uniref:F-box domain-containing protein n=1 Tax=Mycena chlorophos TaxID=658473 RepID=A0ABQ0M136_MYCCL|nr:predicted protein [Mycena chlorophos]
MATTVLLDLLDELIVLIILQLPLSDIGTLLLIGNHRLADIIRSIEVQYWIEQQLLGVEENAKVLRSLPIADRLQELRLREKSERWLEFTPSSRRVIYPPPGTAEYSFDGHVCIAAEAARVHPSMDVVDVPICLRVLQAPSSAGAADNWQMVYRPTEDRTIISYVLASAQDLLCVATSVNSGNHGDHLVQIEVLSLSGEPHPLAKTPSIYVCTHTHEQAPTVDMVVMEDAILCWISGNSLDVFFLPLHSNQAPRRIRLLLPEFVPTDSSHWLMDKTITAVTFPTVPPPDRGGHTHSSSGSRFHSVTDGHITVVNFCIGSSHSYCKLVINAKAFVEFARFRLRPPPRMAHLSWEHWGPQFTRFIRTNEYSGAAQL